MPKGKHKGGRRCFTNFDEQEQLKQKEEKQKAWRKARGEKESDEEDGSGKEEEEESESESSSEEEEEEEAKPKSKGVSDLIEIENPNRVVQKAKKITALDETPTEKPQLSRREREEIQKQQARAHYRKMHAQGKTEEARADLERLALIKKQREEAQQKKDEERKAKEAATNVKKEQVAKALNRKTKS